MVARVALQVARARRRAGARLDLALIEAAALLHDIGKVAELESDRRVSHVAEGVRILAAAGYPEVARIVGNHVISAYVEGGLPESDRVVNYADKRVVHDRVVPLAERLAYIRERYGLDSGGLFARYRRIEDELLAGTDLAPEEIG